MRRSTKSELRMLREMVWHFGTTTKCCFCKKSLLDPGATAIEYGERNSPPVKIKLAIHHENENHEDNDPKNRKPAHSSCHRRYHIKKQHAKANGKRIGARNRKCEQCGNRKPDVCHVTDPYREDISGEKVKMNLCNDCYGDRVQSI